MATTSQRKPLTILTIIAKENGQIEIAPHESNLLTIRKKLLTAENPSEKSKSLHVVVIVGTQPDNANVAANTLGFTPPDTQMFEFTVMDHLETSTLVITTPQISLHHDDTKTEKQNDLAATVRLVSELIAGYIGGCVVINASQGTFSDVRAKIVHWLLTAASDTKLGDRYDDKKNIWVAIRDHGKEGHHTNYPQNTICLAPNDPFTLPETIMKPEKVPTSILLTLARDDNTQTDQLDLIMFFVLCLKHIKLARTFDSTPEQKNEFLFQVYQHYVVSPYVEGLSAIHLSVSEEIALTKEAKAKTASNARLLRVTISLPREILDRLTADTEKAMTKIGNDFKRDRQNQWESTELEIGKGKTVEVRPASGDTELHSNLSRMLDPRLYPTFDSWKQAMARSANMSLKRLTVRSFDKVGFVDFRSEVSISHAEKVIHTDIFMRASALAILFVLTCEGQDHTIIMRRPRFASGHDNFPELPAGMKDLEDIQQKTGIVVTDRDLINLTEHAYGREYGGMYTSPATSNEELVLYLCQAEVTQGVLQDLHRTLKTSRKIDPISTVHVVALADLWQMAPDAKALASLIIYENVKEAGILLRFPKSPLKVNETS